MLAWRAALLLALLLALVGGDSSREISEGREGDSASAWFAGRALRPGAKSKARRQLPERGAAQARADSSIGDGVLWRVRVRGSGRYFYLRDGVVRSSGRFFSLFRLHQASVQGAWHIEVHGGGWLTRTLREQGGRSVTGLTSQRAFNASAASIFWITQRHPQDHSIDTSRGGTTFICETPRAGEAHSEILVVGADREASATCAGRSTAAQVSWPNQALFEWQRIVSLDSSSSPGLEAEGSLAQKVRRSTMHIRQRNVVLATYHNVGMMHWATVFWGWIEAAGIDRMLLLDLDGLSCDASKTLTKMEQISVRIQCVAARDLDLGAGYEGGKKTSSLQEWSTRVNSGYFKFLRMKLRLVELAIQHGVDVVMVDVDVLVLSPSFIPIMVDTGKDLAISSDARTGSYNENRHCPLSNPMYQRFAADWVCAGLFYMRSTAASRWVIQQVQAFMDSYAITDQDAFQVVLTGHSQVALPQVPAKQEFKGNGKFLEGQASPLSPGYRPSGAFLKPLWLEDLHSPGNLRNRKNIQPLNTPMGINMFRRMQGKLRSRGFTWMTLPVERYANGPVLFQNWETVFRLPSRSNSTFISTHFNCNTKQLLEGSRGDESFLLRPSSLS